MTGQASIGMLRITSHVLYVWGTLMNYMGDAMESSA